MLTSKVNVVFHSAATVKFDEELKLAFNINVNGTKRVLSLCNDMTNLKVCVILLIECEVLLVHEQQEVQLIARNSVETPGILPNMF